MPKCIKCGLSLPDKTSAQVHCLTAQQVRKMFGKPPK